jgi:hypothetical protein
VLQNVGMSSKECLLTSGANAALAAERSLHGQQYCARGSLSATGKPFSLRGLSPVCQMDSRGELCAREVDVPDEPADVPAADLLWAETMASLGLEVEAVATQAHVPCQPGGRVSTPWKNKGHECHFCAWGLVLPSAIASTRNHGSCLHA